MGVESWVARLYPYVSDRIWKQVFPRVAHIEPIAGCNLRCPACPSSSLNRKRGLMSLDVYTTVLGKLPKSVKQVNLFWMGEPLLHPKLGDMVRIAKKQGFRVRVATNSVFLKDKYEMLVDSGVDFLKISLDGFSDSSLHKYRKGMHYSIEDVKLGIQRVCSYRELVGSGMDIEVGVLMFQHVASEIPAIRRFCNSAGVDRVVLIKPVTSWSGVSCDIPVASGFERLDQNSWCLQGLLTVLVVWTGDLGLCCYDVETSYSYGNLIQGGFDSVFWSKQARMLRIRAIKRVLRLCKGCEHV